jgi:hypothetical protein
MRARSALNSSRRYTMPEFKLADYGVVGFLLLIILLIVWKLPEIVSAFKGSSKTEEKLIEELDEKGSNSDDKILEGLTTAITKLTTFLETDAAVNKEKDKALYSSIKDIQIAIVKLQENDNEIIKLMTEHALKCDMSCINKRRNE